MKTLIVCMGAISLIAGWRLTDLLSVVLVLFGFACIAIAANMKK